MKKLLTFVFAICMVFSMAACNGEAAPADGGSEGGDAAAETKEWKIGYLAENSADAGQTGPTQDNIVYACEALGVTPVGVVPTDTSPDAIITAVENLINQGVDALTLRNSVHMNGLTATVIDMAEAAGVYVSFYNTLIPEGTDAYAAATESEYFVSAHYNNNKLAGYEAAASLGEIGIEKLAVFGLPLSNLTGSDRYEGIEEAVDEYGMEILVFSSDMSLYSAEGGATVAENFLNAYPEADGIVLTGGIFALLPGYGPVMEGTDVKTAGIDFSDSMSQYIKNGTLYSVTGGHVAGGIYSVILLVNELNSTPLSDGPAFLQDGFLLVNPDNVDDLDVCYFHKQLFTDEEIQNCVVAYNPDATMETLQALIDSYTMEHLMEKYQ
jgi:ABC-type sugar transport system substrate-binding protein